MKYAGMNASGLSRRRLAVRADGRRGREGNAIQTRGGARLDGRRIGPKRASKQPGRCSSGPTAGVINEA
jgi:hypothetical protein